MAAVEFHEVKEARWEPALCRRVQELHEQGRRVYVWAGSEAEARRLDDLLWTFREDSFVPHDLWDGGPPLETPVAVGWAEGNPNRADCLVLARDAAPAQVRGFPRVVDFVPTQDPARLAAARARFRAFREAGMAPTFQTAC